MSRYAPFYADVQSHYDLSDDFFALFLDPSRTYSCAYFEKDDYTLEQAQLAKVDLALGKLGLRPGMTLLDIGCGWGSTMLRALDHYGVDVIGLTLSEHQHAHIRSLLAAHPKRAHAEVRLQGWEEFDGKVDRIVSIGAFEHFRHERHADFFDFAYRALPDDGRMLLHTIVIHGLDYMHERGLKYDRDDIAFMRFIRGVIFPGGQLPFATGSEKLPGVKEFAERAGFTVEFMQPLQLHYARTLDCWAASLEAHRDEAIALCGRETYDTYMHYLTGCAHHFRAGHLDVVQFTCVE